MYNIGHKISSNKSELLHVVCSFYTYVSVYLYIIKYIFAFSGVENSVIFNEPFQHLHKVLW